MKINYKKLIFCIIITFLIGSLFAFTTDNSFYNSLIKPFELPAIIFPIVWSILYIIMSISLYIILESDDRKKKNAIVVYFIQLVVNSLWTPIFFYFKWFLFAFIWIVFLIVLVIIMLYKFYKIKKIASYMNFPYLLWLLFAAYLNFFIYYYN